MYEVNLIWYVYEEVGASQSYPNLCSSHKPSESPSSKDILSVRLGSHPYDHWPQWEVLKHMISVQRRSAMRMKWVGYPNHNMQHHASQKPSESPTPATVCETTHYQVGVASS